MLGKGRQALFCRWQPCDDKTEEVRNLKALYKVENIEIKLSHLIISLERNARELQSEREKVGSLEIQLAHLREAITQGAGTDELVGSHTKFRRVIADVARVAPTKTTVLICGETGTGKELIARAIHARSERKNQPMVTVNCAALPAQHGSCLMSGLTDKPSRLVNFLPWGSRTAIMRSTARACSAWRCQKMVDLDEFLRAASNRVDTKNSF